MSRYTDSKTKLSRRVGRNLFNKGARSFSAKDSFSKHPYKAGQHGLVRGKPPRTKLSEYGKQLTEKQALKFSYGLGEKQLLNLFRKAFTTVGDTGIFVLTSLERRMDSVVYKAGLANSRSQARQLVNHGHFLLNGKKASICSQMVKADDVISIKPSKNTNPFWTNFTIQVPVTLPSWLEVKANQIKVLNMPLTEDLPQEFKMPQIVEYYSKNGA
jgi:small subunit ribosomal protein S4